MEAKLSNHEKQAEQPITYTVDSFANGIAFGQHKGGGEDQPQQFNLRLEEDGAVIRLRSRYALHPENPLHELERHLMRLSRQGVLARARIVFGTGTDPFFPFDGKFDATMKFLDIFRRYRPGLLVVQTRSPLIVLAMPVLRALGKHTAVTMGVETPDDESAHRYTPGLPRIAERLKAAAALRRFGVEVTLQVAPVLPYGDWRADAGAFAQLLVENGDYLAIAPLYDGSAASQRRTRSLGITKALARDRRFHWLRADSAAPLISAVEKLAPEKLQVSKRWHLSERQVAIFAA